MTPDDEARLDNPVWHALATRHRRVAEGNERARRYDPDVSVFGAIEELDDESWMQLAAVAGDGVVLVRADGAQPPDGWTTPFALPGQQMVLPHEPAPLDPAPLERAGEHRALGTGDVPAMLELVEITKPGPFRPRTIELGAFTGVFDGDRLLAMAGQRISLPGYVEISAVCTHPDAQRRGLAAALTTLVARQIIAGGDTPILHVANNNERARRVYEALGFETRRELMFSLVTPPR